MQFHRLTAILSLSLTLMACDIKNEKAEELEISTTIHQPDYYGEIETQLKDSKKAINIAGSWSGSLFIDGDEKPKHIKFSLANHNNTWNLQSDNPVHSAIATYTPPFLTFNFPSMLYGINSHQKKTYTAKLYVRENSMRGHFSIPIETLTFGGRNISINIKAEFYRGHD